MHRTLCQTSPISTGWVKIWPAMSLSSWLTSAEGPWATIEWHEVHDDAMGAPASSCRLEKWQRKHPLLTKWLRLLVRTR